MGHWTNFKNYLQKNKSLTTFHLSCQKFLNCPKIPELCLNSRHLRF